MSKHSGLKKRTYRKQVVDIGNVRPDKSSIKSGEPQRSIFGPLLFLSYINDIELLFPYLNIDLYVDDCTLHESGCVSFHKKHELQKNRLPGI